MSKSKPRVHSVPAGSLEDAARTAIAMAGDDGDAVQLVFNGTRIAVQATDSVRDIVIAYSSARENPPGRGARFCAQ